MCQKFTAYNKVNEIIIKALENNIVPWHRPWKCTEEVEPANLVSKKAYNGINYVVLSLVAYMKGYDSRYWLTFKQASKLGIQIKNGSKATPVVFWKWLEVDNTESGKDEKKEIPFFTYSNVFNLSQCVVPEGLKIEEIKLEEIELNENDIIESCEKVVAGYKDCPKVIHENNNRAYYNPISDIINVPVIERFENSEEYYSTFFHEMVHSTGHKDRLNRMKNKLVAFRNDEYSQEELVAEVGSAYLSFHCGIENVTIDNSIGYIDGWLNKLKDPKNKKWLVEAFSRADKAVQYILGSENK